jgi:hypothetical protein
MRWIVLGCVLAGCGASTAEAPSASTAEAPSASTTKAPEQPAVAAPPRAAESEAEVAALPAHAELSADEIRCGALTVAWSTPTPVWTAPRTLLEAPPDDMPDTWTATLTAVGAVEGGPCAGAVQVLRVLQEGPDKGSFPLGPDWDGYGPEPDAADALDAVPTVLARLVDTPDAAVVLGSADARSQLEPLVPGLKQHLGKRLRWAVDAGEAELLGPLPATRPFPPRQGEGPVAEHRLVARAWEVQGNPVVRVVPRPDGTSAFYVGDAPKPVAAPAVTTEASMPEGGACELLSAAKTSELTPALQPLGTAGDRPVWTLPPGHAHVAALEAGRRATEEQARQFMPDLVALPDDGRVRAWYLATPYGRLQQCLDERLRPIQLAEPLVYLYPETPTQVSVRVDGVPVLASRPPHRDGWTVRAEPDGALTVDGERFDSLFWEAPAGWWPMPAEGWVVRGRELPALLDRVLPQLGLSEPEAADFAAFWGRKHRAARWVRVGVLPQPFVDALAPLHIDPAPDTLLRVHLDFAVVDGPEAIDPPDLPAPPAREGFVVVEWSGTVR